MSSTNINLWGKSHIGYRRKNNEDRFLIYEMPEITILVVADGVGGHTGGEIAAQLVIDTFQEYKFSKNNLQQDLGIALFKAEKRIHHKVHENPDLDGMGTTITTAAIYKDKIFWRHVGDSRMYLLHDKKFKQITTDHTFIQDLIDDGTITLEKAKTHPLKNMLDQCVGCEEIKPDYGEFNIEKNDRLMLCSDGLTKHLSDLQIESILKTDSIQNAGQQMIQAALEMGGTDNVTVIISRFY